MRRLLIGALTGTFILSTSLATAQDAGHRFPHPEHGSGGTEHVSGGTGMGGVETPDTTHSEGEIVATVAAADRGEISLGRFAQTRASNRDVRDYARSMVTMHTASSGRMSTLVRRLNITSMEGVESRRLTADTTATQQRLSRLRGAAFDRAYLDAEIDAHSHLLDQIDRTLLPSIRTADLRTAIQSDVRPMVAAHLAQARTLRERL
jgi:putative membrane protein